jgi:phosphate transport system permease protein
VAGDAYSGQRRRKQTPWSVTFGDALASRIIAVGGIGTIAAILLVVLVLLGTAFPLINSPTYQPWHTVAVPKYEHVGVDSNGLLVWGMTSDGVIEVRSLQNGDLLKSFPLEAAEDEDVEITCSSISIDRSKLVLGFSNGTYRIAQINFETRLITPNNVPTGVSVDATNRLAALDGSVYQWIDSAGIRESKLAQIEWSVPKSLGDTSIVAIDYLPDQSSNRLSSSTESYALAIVGEELVFAEIVGKKNMLTRKVIETVTTQRCPLDARNKEAKPLTLALLNGTDHAVVVWQNGTLDRFSLANNIPKFIESQSAVIGGGSIACAAPLLARQNLLCGLENGRLQGWMITRTNDDVTTSDGYQLALAHEIQVSDKALVSVSSSEQSHVAVTADADGRTALTYVTTDSLLNSEQSPIKGNVRSISLDPSGNALVALTDDLLAVARFDIGHPESSFRSYFGKVWYEGHDEPKYIWQSSSGSERSEIKLSLMPLVFGTMKATVYAMVISIPLAVLAAIYTSEFLSPKTRGRVKPVIEMMASLPSVVLGYIAALVVAPYLQEHLLACLLGLLVVPMSFVLAGNLWNLLPVDLIVRLQSLRLSAMILCLPIAIYLSVKIAQPLESLLFKGNLVQWLGNREGSATGGWLLLLIPFLTVVACMLVFGVFADFSRTAAIRRTPRAYAVFGLVRFAVVSAIVLLAAWGIAAALSSLGLDLRGNLFNSYQDKNALLVGGALGFCVIPIIYTISDDALQAVPASLRSASLGCGATPWQTTIRVVIPSAMSGLFSAVMIGLGRAVGETMVVLMAAGNTPVMEWNPFNGFRTLSATLATELPEAAKGSTHFRTLFLAALLLFLLTLVANTFAEFVRIRFRKRASQL